jgi:hypothetical protein
MYHPALEQTDQSVAHCTFGRCVRSQVTCCVIFHWYAIDPSHWIDPDSLVVQVLIPDPGDHPD